MLLRGQQLRSRGGQLDREREPVERRADLLDSEQVGLAELAGWDWRRGRDRGTARQPGRRPAGASTHSVSPESRSRARLVTSTFRSGHAPMRSTRKGDASATCSKLSSTSKSRRFPEVARQGRDRLVARARRGQRPGHRRNDEIGSATEASSTVTTPSAKSSATSSASVSARRVFPTPPGPVIVSSRRPRSPSTSRSAARSCPRPISLVGCCHEPSRLLTELVQAVRHREPERLVVDVEVRARAARPACGPGSRAGLEERLVGGRIVEHLALRRVER